MLNLKINSIEQQQQQQDYQQKVLFKKKKKLLSFLPFTSQIHNYFLSFLLFCSQIKQQEKRVMWERMNMVAEFNDDGSVVDGGGCDCDDGVVVETIW